MRCPRCKGFTILAMVQLCDLTWDQVATCKNCGWTSNEATDQVKARARADAEAHDAAVAKHIKERALRTARQRKVPLRMGSTTCSST